METITVGSMLISLVCILVMTGLVKAVNWVWLRPKKVDRLLRQQGIPGTSYKFLVGDLRDYSSMRTRAMEKPLDSFSSDDISRIEPLRHQLATKFGKDYFIWVGPSPMIHIAQPELVREALTKMQDFQKPRLNPMADKIFPGILGYEGEKWAKHRRMVNPAFHVEKLKVMLPAFYDSCTDMISKWEKILAETYSGELDVWPHLITLSADVISRAAFGSSYEEGQRVFEYLKEQTELGVLMLQSVYVPGMRYLPTAKNRRFQVLEDRIHSSLEGIVNKRKMEIEAQRETKVDLLGILLDNNSKEIQQAGGDKKNLGNGMSLQDVINECKLFYFAGQETTSVLLVWTFLLLSKYQDWQDRAREEVLQTFGRNLPTFEGLNHLKTVTMILYEVLRLYPPAAQVTRRIYKDATLGDLSLPAGAFVTVPVLFIHRDKEFWGEDAEEFKPDRFSEGVSKASRGNNSFFPFGWGPRICIGEKFAMTEAKMVLCMILQRFAFEISPSYAHAPITVLFLQPQHGAQIILHKLG